MTTTTINLEPDYTAVFGYFARDLDYFAKELVANPNLASLHRWVGPFAVAFDSATTTEQVVKLRDHVGDLLKQVAEKAAREEG